MDNTSQNRLKAVHPELAKRIQTLIENLAAAGLDVRVVQGVRTYDEQNLLYAQGRTRPGKKVTNARGGFSNHNFGLAVDLAPFNDGKADWNDDAAFSIIGTEAKKLGLEWGGDWKKFVDRPHVQLESPDTKVLRKLYDSGGLMAVWNRIKFNKPNIQAISEPEQPRDLYLSTPLMSGEDVRLAQVRLIELGFLDDTADSVFGRKTHAAVWDFQAANGLEEDGILGQNTRKLLFEK